MTTKKPTTKPTTKQLPKLTLEDALRQAITITLDEEFPDLSTKEKSLLVKTILNEHEDGLRAILRGHAYAEFFDLFGDDEDEDDEDEDDEDEDEDEDEDDEDDEEDDPI
jgi:hypothetical protein